MITYEYGRIAKLAQSLADAGIPEELSDQIMAGGEDIRTSTNPVKKADWLREAMLRMDQLLDLETRYAVREACACCLGGKRLKLSKAIAKNYTTLEERIQAANETRFVFGNNVTLLEDGRIMVRFDEPGRPEYRCSCLPQANQPLPITYCFCCGGHVKHHLQIALDRKLKTEVVTTPLSSGGKDTCTFLFTIQ